MKKNHLSYILSFLLIILGCTSLPNVITFPQNQGLMHYITPTEIKDKTINFFSIDSTFFILDETFTQDTSIKYTVAINNKTRKEISNLDYFLRYGENKIKLSKNEIYVDFYRNDIIEIRFESFLSPEQSANLVLDDKNIFIDIMNNNVCIASLDLSKYKEKLNDLRICF